MIIIILKRRVPVDNNKLTEFRRHLNTFISAGIILAGIVFLVYYWFLTEHKPFAFWVSLGGWFSYSGAGLWLRYKLLKLNGM
jgi:drug/metabolite transporter (DMT)-like permease